MWPQHPDIQTDRQTYIHTDRQTEPNYDIDKTGNNVSKFRIRTIDRFRDIEKTLIFG